MGTNGSIAYFSHELKVNVRPMLCSGAGCHSVLKDRYPIQFFQEADMKKILALAGIAAALMTFAPMAAQADPRHDNRGGHHDRYDRNDRNDRDGRWDRNDRRNGWNRNHHGPRYQHHVRRDFGHWRPGLERARYRNFGRPTFYGDYYRVRAHDYRGRLVILDVNAYSGTIIRIGF